jgi:atrial natriuretic peptide receptor A
MVAYCLVNNVHISAHTAEILSIVAGTLLLVLAVISLVFYRNWKYEQELDSLLWKVDYKDIEINDTENSSTSSKISRVSINGDNAADDDRIVLWETDFEIP